MCIGKERIDKCKSQNVTIMAPFFILIIYLYLYDYKKYMFKYMSLVQTVSLRQLAYLRLAYPALVLELQKSHAVNIYLKTR